MVARFFAILAIVLCAVVAERAAAAPEFEQRVFAVVINGEGVSSGSIVLQAADGTVLVAGDDLKRWRIAVAGHAPRTALDGRSYFSLRDFPGVTVRIDESRQILDLRVPGSLFEATTLDLGRSGGRKFDRTPGAFLNYALQGERFSGTSYDQGIFELGASGIRGGVLTTSVGWVPTSTSRFERLNTTWERDFAEARRTLRIGDAISSPGRLGSTVPFAGVQYASDYATDPEFQLSPQLAIRGITPSSSLVDVLINNIQTVNAQAVPAGPFLLNTPPIGIDGQGQVRVVVRDALGGEHVIVEPFYQSRFMLRPGVDEFSYEAGFMRRFGTSALSYGPALVSGTLRHGVTDSVTAEGHLEATSGLALGEFTADLTFPRFGLVSAGIATSFTQAGSGLRALLGYEFRTPRGFGIGATVTAATPQFKTIGLDAHGFDSGELIVTAPVRNVIVSVGVVESHALGQRSISYATLGLSGRLASGTLNLSTTQGISSAPASYFLSYSSRIGRNIVSTRAQNSLGTTRVVTDYATSLPPSGLGSAVDLSVNRQTGKAAYLAGGYELETPIAHFDAIADQNLSIANLRGGLAFVGGRAFATREVTSSYGLAIVPGYPNVRVSVNGLEVGRTDGDGIVALPFLVPYTPNRISLDQRDLPISANIESYEEMLVPYYRSAAIVRFRTGRAGGVTLRLQLPDGTPVAPGSIVMSQDGSQTYPVGDDGLTYLAAVREGKSTFKAIVGGDGACEFTIVGPHDTSAIPDLGTVVCAPAGAKSTGLPAAPIAAPPTAAPAPSVPSPSPSATPTTL